MGAPKGAAKPDTTGFRKKGTGQPVLVPKSEGKYRKRLINAFYIEFEIVVPLLESTRLLSRFKLAI